MSRGVRGALRAVVITAGVACTVAGAFALRADDWKIYAVFVVLAIAFYPLGVEVLPGFRLPMPGLALTLGFLYIAGPAIILLRNVPIPVFGLLRGSVVPRRWRERLSVSLRGDVFLAAPELWTRDRLAAVTDWALFAVGMGVRWWVATRLLPEGRPAQHPGVMFAAEIAGFGCWAALSSLPILSFSPALDAAHEGRLRPVLYDLGLIMASLTPSVFLIAYGWSAHGLVEAAGWSLSAVGLHFILQSLNERRETVEAQYRSLEQLNRELQHRERLSAVGKTSSIVSHQLLQQLGVIGLYADLIRHADGDDAPAAVVQARQNATAIEEALARVNRVLRDLLVFSRDLRVNLYEHRLAEVLGECLEECGPQAAARQVVLRLECPAEPTACLDKLKIRQAVTNVLRNAIEASPAGAEVVVHGRLADGVVEIAVVDRGPGVAEADRGAIFAPFFTTKEDGSGLGLAIAREFAEAHGGAITIEPSADGGATFVLRLPRDGAA